MKDLRLIILAIIILVTLAISGFFGFSNSALDSGINLTNNNSIHENGYYDSVEDVGAYLIKYHKLPSNYMTKSEAHAMGWHGGSIEKYIPGMCIGGDRFTNTKESLPTDKSYKECDIDTLGKDTRGPKRIVYSTDYNNIYYTNNHYASFVELNN